MLNTTPPLTHSFWDDLQGLLASTFLVGLGLFFFKQTGLITSGTAGLSLVLSKMTPLSFGTCFVLLNLPFYYFAFVRMGKVFMIKTFLSVLNVALVADNLHHVLQLKHINTAYAALMGGLLIGVGILMLFRHHSSLGGFNILALYLQDRYQWSAGKILMGLDMLILLTSFFILPPLLIGFSILGALALNMVLTLNHKPGRYMGISRF